MFRFNKNNTINVFLYENVMYYPPVLNLIECLLNNGYKVKLISEGTKDLPAIISDSALFRSVEIGTTSKRDIISRLRKRSIKTKAFRQELAKVGSGDIVWTVNPLVVRTLGKKLFQYSDRHVMELMELTDTFPLYYGAKRLKYPVDEVGRRAWKVVVPEQNRAYIQKVGWNLSRTPYVLPNKPYDTADAEITNEMKPVIEKMKQEKRKIVIYLGVLDPDRDIESFAKGIETIKDAYALYLFGPLKFNDSSDFERFCNTYDCVNYMGFFNPPYHLRFLEHADIALLPYHPGAVEGVKGFSAFNALYCAPNKIYEYAGKNVPMIGTDVPGLRTPFEKFNIGVCCRDLKPETIADAVRYVDANHAEMKKNLQLFYDSTDIDKIVDQIVNETF